jgi:hypothetical protein
MKNNRYRLSGPYTHENLTVFLLHGGETVLGDNYVTLEEALDSQKVVVNETGNVGELTIESLLDDKDVFVQAGEILRGGRQDRTLGMDFVVPAKSGQIPVPTFCVESARWHKRGMESDRAFSSSKHYLSSKKQKLSSKMHHSQHAVWESVAEDQQKLSYSVGESVASHVSPSSLELTLEHEKVQKRREEYIKAFIELPEGKEDVVGFAFAINGQLNSAEVYGSRSLFRRLWKKLIESAAVEALAESRARRQAKEVTNEDVEEFLASTDKGTAEDVRVTDRVHLTIRRSKDSVLFETKDSKLGDEAVHKNYIHEVM